jgi:hypothetical protein
MAILLFGVVPALPLSVVAQKSLSVNGAVLNRTRVTYDGEVRWTYEMMLTIRNDGAKPILIFDCFSNGICSSKITFVNEGISTDQSESGLVNTPIFVQKTPFKTRRSDWWRVTGALDSSLPPAAYVINLTPQIPYETRVKFEIRQKYRIVGKKVVWENAGRSDDDNDPGTPISKAAKFVLEFWFVPMESLGQECEMGMGSNYDNSACLHQYQNGKFLTNLKARWKDVGTLRLDSSGNFFFALPPILNPSERDDELKRSLRAPHPPIPWERSE